MTMTTPTETARGVVTALRQKLAAVDEKAVLLAGEREVISFDAHTGDEKARARLTKVNRELVELDGDAASLKAAVVEAERRVTDAMAEASADFERERARKAVTLGKKMRDEAKHLDKSMRATFDAFATLRETMFEIGRLGAGPSINLVDVSCKRALIAASTGSRLQLELLPPGQRHSVTELAERWAETITAYANQRLGKPEAVNEEIAA